MPLILPRSPLLLQGSSSPRSLSSPAFPPFPSFLPLSMSEWCTVASLRCLLVWLRKEEEEESHSGRSLVVSFVVRMLCSQFVPSSSIVQRGDRIALQTICPERSRGREENKLMLSPNDLWRERTFSIGLQSQRIAKRRGTVTLHWLISRAEKNNEHTTCVTLVRKKEEAAVLSEKEKR